MLATPLQLNHIDGALAASPTDNDKSQFKLLLHAEAAGFRNSTPEEGLDDES